MHLKKALPIGFLMLWATTSLAATQSIDLDPPSSQISLQARNGDALRFHVDIAELQAMDVETSQGMFSRLTIPGFHASQDVGAPELPMLNRLFEIPLGADAVVEIISVQTREIDLADFGILNPLMPVQPSVAKDANLDEIEFVYDRTAYSVEPVARELVQVIEVGTLRSVRFGRLEVSPVAYYPSRGKIVVTESVDFRVNFSGIDHAREARVKAATASPFFEHLYHEFAGHRSQHDDHPDHVTDVATMVIVTPPEFEMQLADFVQWKTERGLIVILAVTGTPEVGTTKEQIRDYLHGLYNDATPERPAPSFVLFVGDTPQIPAWTESSYITDRPYCAVDGDWIPDMYYGRFSATNPTQLQAMIDKTLMYDKFEMPDPSYLAEVVMIAGMDGGFGASHGNGQINYGTEHYFNAAHDIYSHTYLYPNSGSNAANIVQNVSDGVSFINYTAHGGITEWSSPSFTQANINSLQNYGKYCLAVGNCCLTGSFGYGECFGETWLRAEGKGGIGYIGASMSTYWNEDYWWGVGFHPSSEIDGSAHPVEDTGMGTYDGLFHDHGEGMPQWYITNDALIFSGNLAVTEAGSWSMENYWTTYNLQGDPSLSLWIGTPRINNVTHIPALFTTSTSLTIEAAPNSYCGLTFEGQLIGAGTVGETGMLDMNLWQDLVPGAAHLVVMAQFMEPYVTEIEVLPASGPFVMFGSVSIDDIAGDNDGVLDEAEMVDLTIVLSNIGLDTAEAVTATLTSTDPHISVLGGALSFPDIPADGSAASLNSCQVFVEGDAPDGHVAEFLLTINAGNGDWADNFELSIQAPILGVGAVAVDDSADGNGNGRADAGEIVQLQLTLLNTGHSDASAVEGILSSSDPNIVILDGSAMGGGVPEGGGAPIGTFTVEILPLCPEPHVAQLQLHLTGIDGFMADCDLELAVGGWFDDFESDRAWTVSSTAAAGIWTRVDPVGTIYNSQFVQPEDDHTPIPGTDCFVTGNGPVGGPVGGSDIDDGATTLYSPIFHLAGAETVELEYWRWYTNNSGPNPNEDYWVVQVTNNGADWVDLENTSTSDASWTRVSFDLLRIITPTDAVQIRFIASDEGGDSWVEAAVDDLLLNATFGIPTGMEEQPAPPTSIALGGNFPNPFNPTTTIKFDLPGAAHVDLAVYDVTGRRVLTLISGRVDVGRHEVVWNGRDGAGSPVVSGVYFARLASDGARLTQKMLLLK